MVNFLDDKIANLTLIKNLTLTTPFFQFIAILFISIYLQLYFAAIKSLWEPNQMHFAWRNPAT